MLGAILVVVVMLIMVPLVLITGGLLFAVTGWSVQADVEQQREGSELIELNR